MPDDQCAISLSKGDPLDALVRCRQFVVGQLGQSLDGYIATRTGHSKYINHVDGLSHLHRLRAAVDAVLVGVGTVNDDDPMLTVRHCVGESPVRVIVDPNGRVFENAQLFKDNGPPVIILCRDDLDHPLATLQTPHVSIIKLPHIAGRIAPQSLITALADRGLDRLLIEGGSRTLSAFLDAGCLDRLHLIVAPVLLGGGYRGVGLSAIKTVNQAIKPKVAAYSLGHDLLFDCDFRSS